MAIFIPAPTLDETGWATAPTDKADALLSDAFEANASQTYLYKGRITSIQKIIEQSANDMIALVNNLKNALEVYLNRYYLNSSVEVSYKADAKDESNITITIYCIVTEQDNTQYSLGRLLEVADSKITKIMRINNG